VKYVGVKTVTSLALLLFVTLGAWRGGVFNLDRLRILDPLVLFYIGLFSSFTSALFYRFWELKEKSRYRFGYSKGGVQKDGDMRLLYYKHHLVTIGPNSDYRAYELPPVLQRGIYTVVFLFFCFLTFSNRGLKLIKAFPESIDLATSRYCQDKEVEDKDDPEMLGCKLLRRAYQLGFTKELGNCETKLEGEGEEAICKFRQKDEPYLHYTWRQIDGFWAKLKKRTSVERREIEKAKFDKQLDQLKPLLEVRTHAMQSSPRAAHHLWTNLPRPGGWFSRNVGRVLNPGRCLTEYRDMSHTPVVEKDDPRADGVVLDHIFGQLLFNPRIHDSVGYCREYHIHWEAPLDSCQRLAKNPKKFLEEHAALESVNIVLDRFALVKKMGDLKKTLDELDPPPVEETKNDKKEKVELPKPILAKNITSFQCFMEKEKGITKRNFHKFKYRNHRFLAWETTVTKEGRKNEETKVPVFAYKKFASLMAPGFVYLGFLSNRGTDSVDGDVITKRMFVNPEYRITKLEFLKNADIFLGEDWIQRRDDVLEVYPWYHHLYHFVKMFRREYELQRGRL